jgi:hypothetical protein
MLLSLPEYLARAVIQIRLSIFFGIINIILSCQYFFTVPSIILNPPGGN